MCKRLNARPYVNTLTYITKEEALKEATRDLGTNRASLPVSTLSSLP